MMRNEYNPDVLTCLANLSNDEVFTPPHIANQMLDTLPAELWSNPKAKFLDPFTKSGIFLREIAKRLLEGLKEQIPDLQQRIDHIMQNQIYGIGITELTSLLARRSLYCTKNADSEYSVANVFENAEGNIAYENIPHTWGSDGKCTYCGVSKNVMGEDQREGMENHAYMFIHDKNPFENMQFDVIIGNPPYQLSDGGGTGDSAKPIYHLFIEQAIKLEPHYLCMIVPSRWMKGGKGLDSFREQIINDTRLKTIFDFESANEVFSGINLDGGVCYFLWVKDYNGKCLFVHQDKNKEVITSERFLKTEISNTVIRDFRQISIISKVKEKNETLFSAIVSKRKPYGISTDLFNDPAKYGYKTIPSEPFDNSYKIYGVKGNKGGAKRMIGYIKKTLAVNTKNVSEFKLFQSYAYTTTATVPPEIILGLPNEICTETFLKIGDFNNKIEALNCLSYTKTKFYRALLFFNRIQKNLSQSTFDFIPLQDFSKPWTDEELYKKYSLTEEEIQYIEDRIDVME